MPIYEYKCKECGKIFEIYQRLSERDEDIKCPACGAEKPVKRVSAFSSYGDSNTSTDHGSCGSGRSGFG